MSVKVRERVYRDTNTVTWQADIHVKLLDGRRVRERCRIPGATSRSSALKWARERERWLIVHGHEKAEAKEDTPVVPTLAEFCTRWMTEYVVANRLKPSSVETKKILIRANLVPNLGDLRLDAITEADVQRLKAHYAELRPSTVNNMLTCLATILKSAIEWKVIDEMPTIRKLKKPADRFDYYEDGPYERLVAAACEVDPRSYLVVLLGGDAGLRGGEMLALEWDHCDLSRGVLSIEANEWRGHVDTPKGNRSRQVVMTRGCGSRSSSGCGPRGATASSSATEASRRPRRASTAGSTGPRSRQGSRSRGRTSSATPFARASPPAGPHRERSRNWPVTSTRGRPTATSTWRRAP